MTETRIEWTRNADGSPGKTWNPVRGCARVSPGCEHCYAERQAHRFSGRDKPYAGLTVLGKHGPRWSGKARFVPEMLGAPLHWRAPQRVFVNSMADLWHDDITDAQIAEVFAVMAACPHHTFQVLTKRPKRMLQWFRSGAEELTIDAGEQLAADMQWCHAHEGEHWPLPNLWLGVSCEDQERADERIPLLLQTPAALRFVSAEPLLGPVDLGRYLKPTLVAHDGERLQHPDPRVPFAGGSWEWGLNWVIVGGESGPGARACDTGWVRSIVAWCNEAKVSCFVKQLGGHVFAPWKTRWHERLDGSFDLFSPDRVGVKGTNLATVWPNGTWHTWDAVGTGGENSVEASVDAAKSEAIAALCRQHASPIKGWSRHKHMLVDRKGGDPSEWPADLRVRQWPGEIGRRT
jgi:protein gp37